MLQDVVQLVQSLASGETTTKGRKSTTGEDATTHLERFGRWLFAETHGQPFYVAETLNALLEQRMLTLRSHADGRSMIDFSAALRNQAGLRSLLPAGVRAVIQSRLAQLSSTAFSLLAAGAVLEHDFTFEQLCQVTAVEEVAGLTALDELLAGHLLHVAHKKESPLVGAYSFTHDKIRDVMYAEAGEARRRMLHRRALQALQHAATSTSAAVLAHHAHAAGLTEAAFQFGLAAGKEAMRLFAVHDAIAHYKRAQQLVGEQQGSSNRHSLSDSIPLSAVQQLYMQLGRAYEFAAEWDQAYSIYQTLLVLAHEWGASMMECTALNRLAMLTAQVHFDLKQAVV